MMKYRKTVWQQNEMYSFYGTIKDILSLLREIQLKKSL